MLHWDYVVYYIRTIRPNSNTHSNSIRAKLLFISTLYILYFIILLSLDNDVLETSKCCAMFYNILPNLYANNPYGWAMSQYLPRGNFKWMREKQINKLDLAKYTNDSTQGLILKVDLEYPDPEKPGKVSEDMLSNYCQKIAEKYKISMALAHKLIPTLKKQRKVCFSLQNHQFYFVIRLSRSKSHEIEHVKLEHSVVDFLFSLVT